MAARTAQAAAGRHVLALQDTSELDCSACASRTAGPGGISKHSGRGLFIHPVLAVDAHSHACLGIAHQGAWLRDVDAQKKRDRQPTEPKESMRWLQGPQAAAQYLRQAALVTVVADRESDLYELWDRIPDVHTHLLTRARCDRPLEGGGVLCGWLAAQPAAACDVLDVPARPKGKAYGSKDGARTAHRAHMELRFGRVCVLRPEGCRAKQARITLSVVAVVAVGR